ncbi:MAG: hypothetical protein ACXWVJ_01080 [Caulobacteraceae bacterium]
MAFDAELRETTQSIAYLIATSAREPSPDLVKTDPARALAMLYVDPRPCAALDALLDS